MWLTRSLKSLMDITFKAGKFEWRNKKAIHENLIEEIKRGLTITKEIITAIICNLIMIDPG